MKQMKKIKYMIIGLGFILSNLLSSLMTLADYVEPTAKTNINKIDPLFEENISNYTGFRDSIEQSKAGIVEGIKNKQGLQDLPGHDDSEGKVEELKNIRANDLEGRGRDEYAKDPSVYDYFVDYSKPGNAMHRSDAEKIADATGKLMGDLTALFKELHVDCKTEKGNKEVEPEYFIEIDKKKDPHGDTAYDQYLCEQLNNRYSCTDAVTLTCMRTGMKYGEWQNKEIKISGDEAYGQYGWFNEVRLKKKRFILELRSFDWVKGAIRNWIAAKTQKTIEQIGGVDYGPRGDEPSHYVNEKQLVFSSYTFRYQYREGWRVCEEWKEDWTERCRLN